MPTFSKNIFNAKAFGEDFHWGVAIAAQQNEGAWNVDGRGQSIWDAFARRPGKIKGGAKPSDACGFYYRYKDDLLLAKALGFKAFRFSISWSRILPDGAGKINKEGIAFYHKVIEECLHLGMVPFVTLYHWDLPNALEKEGGWANHNIIKWFAAYIKICAEEYGSSVKNWIIMNEPAGFTTLGYMLGKHAPGKMGLNNVLPAIHHAVMATAEGGRVIRQYVHNAHIGTTYSCSEVLPFTDKEEDKQAAKRVDILLNRLFIEPALGRGYPRDDFKFLEKLELHNHAWK